MKKNRLFKKIGACALSVVMLLSSMTVFAAEETVNNPLLEPYEETVTIEIGRPMVEVTVWADGESYDDNAVLDYIKEKLNIEIEWYSDVMTGAEWTEQLNMCIAADIIPEFVWCGGTDQLNEMVDAGMIYPMTELYDEYITEDTMIYKHYQWCEETFGKDWHQWFYGEDGELYGLSRTSLETNAGILLRKDWLDDLGITLDEDEDGRITLDEIEMVAQAFVDNDPEGNGNVGLVMEPALASTIGAASLTRSSGMFTGAYFVNDEGKVEYGGITKNSRELVEWFANMYSKGLIDPEFTGSGWNEDIEEKWDIGQSGMCILISDSAIWAMNGIYDNQPDAEMAYYDIASVDGTNYWNTSFGRERMMVARADAEHPEAMWKIYELMLDLKYNGSDDPQLEAYRLAGDFDYIDPLCMAIQTYNRNIIMYEDVMAYINGEITLEEVDPSYTSYAETVKRYIDDPDGEFSTVDRGTIDYVLHGGLASVTKYNGSVDKLYFNLTDLKEKSLTYTEKNTDLRTVEDETFVKIVLGEEPIEAWDEFVEYWYANGGQDILDELQAWVDANP